jgi:mutator protein MutT
MIGSTYAGEEICRLFGGQRGTRIRTPKAMPLVLLFAGRRYRVNQQHPGSGGDCCASPGEPFGCCDGVAANGTPVVLDPEEGWNADGFYHFQGERQMHFVRGNRAVRDHARDGKLLLLFEEASLGRQGASMKRRVWRFVGPMECAGHYFAPLRSAKAAIVFLLAPVSSWSPWQAVLPGDSRRLSPVTGRYPLAFLKSRPDAIAARAEKARHGHPSSAREWLASCLRIQGYVRDRSLGFCEMCGKPTPFANSRGEPCLEVHYMLRPYDSGVDPVHYLAACCLECHGRIHCGPDGRRHDEALARRVAMLERSVDRDELLTVTAGVIHDADGKVLLTQRGHGALAGKWEFPGGKVEAGETLEACLAREIREELDLAIGDIRPLAASVYHYDDFAVRLFGLSARATGNHVELREHANGVWVWPSELTSYDLSPADLPVAAAVARPMR